MYTNILSHVNLKKQQQRMTDKLSEIYVLFTFWTYSIMTVSLLLYYIALQTVAVWFCLGTKTTWLG